MDTVTTTSAARTACFLDCDGVLVDSESLSAGVLSQLLVERGVDLPEAQALAFLRGRRVAEWIAELFARHGLGATEDPAVFEQTYRDAVTEQYDVALEAEPGAQDLLDALAQHDVPHAVVSNAPLWKIRHGLDTVDLRTRTPHYVSAYDLGTWKPEPGVYLEGAALLGVEPSAGVAVEDSDAGITSAHAAGMRVVHYCRDADVPTHPLATVRSHDHARTTRLVLELAHEGVAA